MLFFNDLWTFSVVYLGPCCENCWDSFPKLLQQAHSLLLVVCGEMGIPQSHTDVLVFKQFFHCGQINP